MSPIRKKPGRRWLAAAGLLLAGTVLAQQDTVRLNYRNTDLQEVVEAVAEATGRNFVIDPQVGADRKVNLFGSQPLSPEAYYQAFLSMLSAHGIVAVPSGPVIRLSPDRTMRIFAGAGPESSANDELQTLVLSVDSVDAQGLVPIVRPMMSPGAHVAAHPPTNVLILSGRGSNVNKVARVIRRIDRKNDQPVEVISAGTRQRPGHRSGSE